MASPFGLSIGDLASAIRLSRDIYINCFTEGQGANIKYRQFVNDIQALGSSLTRLQDVVRRSEEQYPRLDWYSGATGLGAVQNLWSQLTGDFYQTLQECESLLNRNGHLRNGRTSVAYNLHWWLSAEDAVDNLTAKLRFHITKVEFYTIPSEFDSIVRNGSQIQQLRRQVANLERMMINGAGPSQTLWANFLPNELKAKFDTEFNQNRPLWLAEGSEWPLKEGMEALAFHFARGTVRFEPTSELGNIPGWRPYLNLAKSIWILEQIKQSDHFKAASPESFWAGYMRELEDALRGQLHRFESGELDKPSTQGLLELSDRFYSIDKREEVISDPLDAGKAGPLEEKILEIELPSETSNRNSALLVFRENEADFRLVISTKADALVAQYDLADCVNMDRHRLVPAYSNPARGSSTRNNLLLLNERGRQGREYTFRDPADVRKFQRALTGYRVHHDMPVARWCLNGSQQDGDSGEGMLQLWQFKPLPPMLESTPPEASGAHSLAGSPRSPTVSGTTLLSQTSIMSPVRGPRSGGIEFSKPELPVLIILTRTNQKYTFLHLTLDPSIHVQPKSCGCRKPNLHCTRVILESKKYFSIRVLSADEAGDRGLESWDLSVFRYPRPEKFNRTVVNGKVKTLELRFGVEEEKNEFLRELISLENNRTTNENDYSSGLKGKRK